MEVNQCRMCQYYIQHYGLKNGKLFRIYCGHCVREKAKRRKPDSKSCEFFVPGDSDENAFASKNFLRKELLKYVLEMELLPEIEDYSP